MTDDDDDVYNEDEDDLDLCGVEFDHDLHVVSSVPSDTPGMWYIVWECSNCGGEIEEELDYDPNDQ